MIANEICIPVDLASLVAMARAHLYSLFDDQLPLVTKSPSSPALARVNVTLRTVGNIRGSMSSKGGTLIEQVLDAVFKASRDHRFSGSIVRADLEKVSIEVWLQLSSELISLEEREASEPIRLGQEGVKVEQGTAFAYYKPSVAITSNFSTAQELFGGVCKKAGLPQDAWKDSSCILRKTTWIHLCETPHREVTQMAALRPASNLFSITTDNLVEWVRGCTSYLKWNQHIDGSFCHRYRPLANETRKGSTNPVRASGCVYAIAAAASSAFLDSDADIKRCADHAADAILRRLTQLKNGSYFVADSVGGQSGKLGTSALYLLALLTPALREKYAHEADELLAAIKTSQSSDGFFECVFGGQESGSSQINFFPG